MKKSQFVFHEHYIEYPDGTTKHWDIRVKGNSHLEEWNIYEDPRLMEKDVHTQVAKKICRDLKWLEYDKQWIKVGGIPTYVDILDKGEVLVDQKSSTEVFFTFKGEFLKGKWQLLRKGKAWIFTKVD